MPCWFSFSQFPFNSTESKSIQKQIVAMKLRLRSLESKETHKIEVPNPCSLHLLKTIVSLAISGSSASSLHLSLNRKDELLASSPDDSLQSIGIAAGDLVFYTLNPNSFSRETLPHKPTPQPEVSDSSDRPMIQSSSEINATGAPSAPAAGKTPALDVTEAEAMEIDDGSDEAVVGYGWSNFQPLFVKRVLREAAIGNDDVSDFKLLILSVHAVILESGFVRVDQVSGMAVNCSHLLDDFPSGSTPVKSLRYTLPEILTNGSSQTVSLKIQTLGHIVNVCGSLSNDNGSRLHMVYLDRNKFAPPLEFLLANSESKVGGDQSGNRNKVFELWKMVKDGLALPLLIDLCEKAGLDLPLCFMRLPTDLKLIIMENLPGVDLAKVACLNSEMRYLASNNELWKKKFKEEFGIGESAGQFFKHLFAQHWTTKKNSEQPHRRANRRNLYPRRNPNPFGVPPIWGGGPNPFGVPPIWGGEYDLQPNIGGQLPANPRRRTFLPPCHLGGFDA